jgi:hypothetical protein
MRRALAPGAKGELQGQVTLVFDPGSEIWAAWRAPPIDTARGGRRALEPSGCTLRTCQSEEPAVLLSLRTRPQLPFEVWLRRSSQAQLPVCGVPRCNLDRGLVSQRVRGCASPGAATWSSASSGLGLGEGDAAGDEDGFVWPPPRLRTDCAHQGIAGKDRTS